MHGEGASLKKLCTGNEEGGEVESETGEKGDKKGGKAGADKMGWDKYHQRFSNYPHLPTCQ